MTKQKQKWHFHFLDAFLIFVPVSIALYFLHVNALYSFLVTAAALAGITHLMAESTNIIAQRVSNTISALINATFGNAVELFIAIFSLRAGLFELVKASITGSIILNVLLLIGVSMLAGGFKYKEQKFNKDSAGLSSTMLIVAVVGLALPSMYSMVVGAPARQLSLAVSIIMGIVYLLSLIYTLVTHRHLFVVERQSPEENHDRWSGRASVAVLLIATLLASFESSFLVNTIQPLLSQTGFTESFMGLVFVAFLTNIPEISSAMTFARKNNMTLSLEIGMSSALQIALFVVPILILISPLLISGGFDLVFTPFELVAVVITAMIANYIGSDGVCHWVEGAQLMAVYLLIATAFYFL
ncbi:MAG: calcium/proton exchanger [Dehalococcoidales bacterium]|nr:calcium/proton exchanger [Dehalococcoidales bacterium]